MILTLFASLLTGCVPDASVAEDDTADTGTPATPAGWDDAERITDFTQESCEGDPYEPFDVYVGANQVGDTVEVRYDKAHFRCKQAVEGYFKLEGDLLSILVQPVDMDPEDVAGCDCLYTLDMGVTGEAATVEMWRRWDNWNDPNDPELVGEAEVILGPT